MYVLSLEFSAANLFVLSLLLILSVLSFCLRNNGRFPVGPGLAGTRMSPFWIILELRVIEVVSGDNWS